MWNYRVGTHFLGVKGLAYFDQHNYFDIHP